MSSTEDTPHTTWMHVAYGSLALGLLLSPIVAIPGVVLTYRRRDVDDPVIASHAAWCVRTFWWVVGLTIAFLLTYDSIASTLILVFGYGFYIYRVVKGWHAFAQDDPITDTFLRDTQNSE